MNYILLALLMMWQQGDGQKSDAMVETCPTVYGEALGTSPRPAEQCAEQQRRAIKMMNTPHDARQETKPTLPRITNSSSGPVQAVPEVTPTPAPITHYYSDDMHLVQIIPPEVILSPAPITKHDSYDRQIIPPLIQQICIVDTHGTEDCITTERLAQWLKILQDTGFSSATAPVDVPPIQEEYGNPGITYCDIGYCSFYETSEPDIWLGQPKRRTRLTCADKSRFLMTAEDGSKHCIRLTEEK